MKYNPLKAAQWAADLFFIGKNRFKKFIRRLYSGQHQLTSTTSIDRYPELFQSSKQFAPGFEQLTILSFGCSTGEECFTLRRYFPMANIVGVDINRLNLRKARSVNRDPHIHFAISNQANLKRYGKFHMIFCLSVLCRWEDTMFVTNCEDIYPFEKFEREISNLSNLLEDGGLLIIYNSNFRFEDTREFQKFDIITTPDITDSGFVYKFDSNNNRIYENHAYCIYRKKSNQSL